MFPISRSSRRFPLHADWGFLLPFFGLLAAVAFVIVYLAAPVSLPQRFWLAGGVALAVFGALILLPGPRLQVTPDGIQVLARWARAGSPLPTRLPLQELRIETAEVVDLGACRDLMPRDTLLSGHFGGRHGMPQGFFSLTDGQHAVVLLSRWTGVLYLPTRSGTVWLASLRKPHECLELLRSLSGPSLKS